MEPGPGQLVERFGLCNATVPTIRKALGVLPVASVQNNYSLYVVLFPSRSSLYLLPSPAAAACCLELLAFERLPSK
jgi:hypothetical protein